MRGVPKDIHDLAMNYFTNLPDQELRKLEVCLLHFIGRKSADEIAEITGYKKSYVYTIQRDFTTALKDGKGDEYFPNLATGEIFNIAARKAAERDAAKDAEEHAEEDAANDAEEDAGEDAAKRAKKDTNHPEEPKRISSGIMVPPRMHMPEPYADAVIELRRKHLSVPEIRDAMCEKGMKCSFGFVYRILKMNGFPALRKRPRKARRKSPKTKARS